MHYCKSKIFTKNHNRRNFKTASKFVETSNLNFFGWGINPQIGSYFRGETLEIIYFVTNSDSTQERLFRSVIKYFPNFNSIRMAASRIG